MSEPTSPPALGQVNIVVRDLRKSLAFYRLLGLSIQNAVGIMSPIDESKRRPPPPPPRT